MDVISTFLPPPPPSTAKQRRKVNCRLPNGTAVHPRLCDRRQKPVSRRECYNDRCRGAWRVEPWSACSARCGAAGYRTRILRCVWYGTNKPAGNTCRDQPRPMVYKPCYGPPCPTCEYLELGRGVGWVSLVWFGLVWFNVVWFVVVWPGLAWPGHIRSGQVCSDLLWSDRPDLTWSSLACLIS